MTDTGTGPGTTPPTGIPPPPGVTRPQLSAQETEAGKVFAILSYVLNFIGVPFWLVPLIMRNNEFSLYHAKQCLMLWLVGLAGYTASAILTFVCVGPIVALVVFVAMVVWNIMGLINAMNGRVAPVPLIGIYAEKWFAGITKV